MSRWWTIQIPTDFNDVSEKANAEPALAEMLESRRKLGSAAMHLYKPSQGGSLMVIEQINTKYSAVSKGELERREETERASNGSVGKEIDYRVDVTTHLVVGTQKAMAGEILSVQKRWMGVATDDSTRTLEVMCTAREDVCQSVMGTVVVDEAQFRRLDSLKPITGTDVGSFVALGFAAVGFLGVAVVMFRRRKRLPVPTTTEASPEA